MKGKSLIVRNFLIMLFFVGFAMNSHARQREVPPDFKPDLSTPWHSVLTHIYFLQSDSYDVDKAAIPFLHPGVDSVQARDLAVKLKQAWDARGYLVNFDNVPRETNYLD
jgi:MscS family membrane protein